MAGAWDGGAPSLSPSPEGAHLPGVLTTGEFKIYWPEVSDAFVEQCFLFRNLRIIQILSPGYARVLSHSVPTFQGTSCLRRELTNVFIPRYRAHKVYSFLKHFPF